MFLVTCFVLINLFFVQAQTEQQNAVKAALNDAAQAYKLNNFAEAQQHAERALSLDPTNKTAMIFVARTIHAQYKPGIDTPENRAKAYEAITAYKRVVTNDPTNEESFLAVYALYSALREGTEQYKWAFQHANNTAVASKKRAYVFALLASKSWLCAFEITELTKQTKGTKIVWVKPKNQKEFEKLKQCVANGINATDQAIALDPESELGWTYKANLLREQAKIYEMEKRKAKSDESYRQVEEAEKKLKELIEKNRQQIKETSPDSFEKKVQREELVMPLRRLFFSTAYWWQRDKTADI